VYSKLSDAGANGEALMNTFVKDPLINEFLF